MKRPVPSSTKMLNDALEWQSHPRKREMVMHYRGAAVASLGAGNVKEEEL